MTTAKPDPEKPLRGRRLSWREFEQLTGRKKPQAANDNEPAEKAA